MWYGCVYVLAVCVLHVLHCQEFVYFAYHVSSSGCVLIDSPLILILYELNGTFYFSCSLFMNLSFSGSIHILSCICCSNM